MKLIKNFFGMNHSDDEAAEFSALVAGFEDAIVSFNESEEILFFNSRFALLHGSGTEIRGKKMKDLLRSGELFDSFKKVLSNGQALKVEIQMHSVADMAHRDFSVSITPLRPNGRGKRGVIGIFHDVTELKKAERLRIDFVANVSHELRSPLASIKGYTDTLKGDLAEKRFESAPQFLDVISKNVERLSALVEDLLDLSALESGAEVHKASVQLKPLTERVLYQLEQKRKDKRIDIQVHFEVDDLMADQRRIEQILVNLIENAVKYTQLDGKIWLSWEKLAEFILLKVKDNGPGIPLDAQERLFERFFRVDKARSRDYGGTGLGLAIVKHIMIRHGGKVLVKSSPGNGSEFICEFPRF